MNHSNYRDFYQKSLIPIGLSDYSILSRKNINPFISLEESTHWLIALECESIQQHKGYYYWKVSIYPSNSAGSFDWNHPFYSSPQMRSLDKALELARTIEYYIRNDELHSANLQVKIS